MVRKNGVQGLKAKDVEARMALCQWRTWKRNANIEDNNERDDSAIVTSDKRNELDLRKARVKNSDEASTSTEAKKDSVMGEQQQVQVVDKVDCGVQIEEDFNLVLEDSFEVQSCVVKTFPIEALPEMSLGKMAA